MTRIVATAPGRAGILGNPTDGYGGCVISCTVPFRAEAAFEPGPGGLKVVLNDREGDLTHPASWSPAGDDFDLVRAVLRHLRPSTTRHGLLRISTTIPRQAGLSGSTALIAVVFAVLDPGSLNGHEPAPLAERLRVIERHGLGVQCGFQDQYSIVHGGLNYLDFAGKERQGTVPPEPYARVTPLVTPLDAGLPFVVAHTGQAHDSGTVHAPLRERWEAGEAAVVEGYARIGALCREGLALFAAEEWERVGALMDENHAIQRDLGGSGAANEALIAAAKAAGAYGAKLAGAGRGGTIIALHPDTAALEAALREAGAVRVFRLGRFPGLSVRNETH